MAKRTGGAQSRTGKAAPGNAESTLISHAKLKALYAGLLECRAMQQQHGEDGKRARMAGDEAVVVGSTINLGHGDAVCSVDHGILTGFSTGATIASLLLRPGNHQGGTPGVESAASLANRNGASPSAAGRAWTHSAIGVALANKTKTNQKVSLFFSREESREIMGDALHIATINGLPMIFVHQADGGPERGGRRPRGSKKKPSKPETPWFPSITVDRDDVVAVYRVAAEAISRARLGRGPTLIECRPYRLNGKPAAGNDWHTHDPVRNLEHYLRVKGLLEGS